MSTPKPRTSSQLRASRFNYLRRHAHGMKAHAETVIKEHKQLHSAAMARLEKAYSLYLAAIDEAHHALIRKDWHKK